MRRPMLILALTALALTSLVSAADPPDRINYQGVLRNSADEPLDGSFPMTFRFFDSLTEGNEILVDTHEAVTVTGGLFNVQLGSGTVADGAGPGTYTSLAKVLGDYPELYLKAEVNGEDLSPRISVASAGYALNTRQVRGMEIVSDGPLDLYANAIDGDDADDGLSPDTAKQTIHAAVTSVPSILQGDVTIHVADGTYNESIVVGGHSRANGLSTITIVGNELAPNLVILDGESIRVNAILTSDLALIVAGMTIRNYAEAVSVQEASLNIEHCTLTGNTDGGLFVFAGEANVTDCRIENNSYGISVVQGRVALTDCTITGNSGDGVDLEGAILWLEPGSLSISDNGGRGVHAGSNTHVNFHDRSPITISDNAGGDMVASYQSTIRGYENATTGGCTADAHSTCEP